MQQIYRDIISHHMWIQLHAGQCKYWLFLLQYLLLYVKQSIGITLIVWNYKRDNKHHKRLHNAIPLRYKRYEVVITQKKKVNLHHERKVYNRWSNNCVKSYSVFKYMVISHILNETKVGFDGEGPQNSFIILEEIANKNHNQKDERVDRENRTTVKVGQDSHPTWLGTFAKHQNVHNGFATFM